MIAAIFYMLEMASSSMVPSSLGSSFSVMRNHLGFDKRIIS